jgi:hypothetical protein
MERIELEVNKTNISKFKDFEYARRKADLRAKNPKKTIAGIVRSLEINPFIYDSLIVSESKGQYEIIAGHHRKCAIEHFLQKYPDAKVNVSLVVHNDLTLQQKIELYTMLDDTTNKQTMSDRFVVGEPLLLIKSLIKRKFPIKIQDYNNDSTITYAFLFQLWHQKESKEYLGLKKNSLFDVVKSWDSKVYMEMLEFFGWFQDLFGVNSKDNLYYSFIPLNSIIKLYFRNKLLITDSKGLFKFRKVIFNNFYFKEHRTGGRQVADYVYGKLVEQLNHKWHKLEWI